MENSIFHKRKYLRINIVSKFVKVDVGNQHQASGSAEEAGDEEQILHLLLSLLH